MPTGEIGALYAVLGRQLAESVYPGALAYESIGQQIASSISPAILDALRSPIPPEMYAKLADITRGIGYSLASGYLRSSSDGAVAGKGDPPDGVELEPEDDDGEGED